MFVQVSFAEIPKHDRCWQQRRNHSLSYSPAAGWWYRGEEVNEGSVEAEPWSASKKTHLLATPPWKVFSATLDLRQKTPQRISCFVFYFSPRRKKENSPIPTPKCNYFFGKCIGSLKADRWVGRIVQEKLERWWPFLLPLASPTAKCGTLNWQGEAQKKRMWKSP